MENGKWSSVGTHRLGKNAVETIEANKPYLVKLKDGYDKGVFAKGRYVHNGKIEIIR